MAEFTLSGVVFSNDAFGTTSQYATGTVTARITAPEGYQIEVTPTGVVELGGFVDNIRITTGDAGSAGVTLTDWQTALIDTVEDQVLQTQVRLANLVHLDGVTEVLVLDLTDHRTYYDTIYLRMGGDAMPSAFDAMQGELGDISPKRAPKGKRFR